MLRGFLGRLSVAIEPLIVGAFFTLLPFGLLLRKQETALLLAPIFAFAALGFLTYSVVLMVPSTRALIETFAPIYVVDGYVRYAKRARGEAVIATVSVLDAERTTLGEWPLREWPRSIGERDLWPALVEFSEHGGIHRIDGRSTGVLPTNMPVFGIGMAADPASRRERGLN